MSRNCCDQLAARWRAAWVSLALRRRIYARFARISAAAAAVTVARMMRGTPRQVAESYKFRSSDKAQLTSRDGQGAPPCPIIEPYQTSQPPDTWGALAGFSAPKAPRVPEIHGASIACVAARQHARKVARAAARPRHRGCVRLRRFRYNPPGAKFLAGARRTGVTGGRAGSIGCATHRGVIQLQSARRLQTVPGVPAP